MKPGWIGNTIRHWHVLCSSVVLLGLQACRLAAPQGRLACIASGLGGLLNTLAHARPLCWSMHSLCSSGASMALQVPLCKGACPPHPSPSYVHCRDGQVMQAAVANPFQFHMAPKQAEWGSSNPSPRYRHCRIEGRS